MRLRRSAGALLAALGLALVSACGGGEGTGENEDSGLQKVTYLTSFKQFGREAYAYVALEKGYFKDAGFDVKINPGNGTVDTMKLVAGGQADYGVGDFTGATITLSKQKLPVTMIAAIHQKSMAGIMAFAGGRITADPKSLEAKAGQPKIRIGDQPGSTNQVMFPVYAGAAGIAADSVEFVPSAPPALPTLLASDKVDGIGQFAVGVPLIEKADQTKHRKAVYLSYGEQIQDLYGNSLMTRSDLAKKHPDQVKKFTEALLKGLQDSLTDPEGAASTLAKHVEGTDVEVSTQELKIQAEYVKATRQGDPIGAIDPQRVDRVLTQLRNAKALERQLTTQDVITASLTPKG